MEQRQPFRTHGDRQWVPLALGLIGLGFFAACGDSPTGSTNGTPPAPTLQSLSVTGELDIEEGLQSQLTVMANFSDGRNRDVTSQSAYTSSDNAVVTVNASGLMTGVSSGSASVDVSYQEGGVTRQAGVEVRVSREIPEFNLRVAVSAIRILEDCDPGPFIQTGPGEFTYRVTTRFPEDAGDVTLTERTSPVSRNNGESIGISRSRSVTYRGNSGSATFGYYLTEWDGNTPDSNMNNRRGSRGHSLQNGQWSGTGSNSVTIGPSGCRAQMNYTFTATRTN
jgi:hypothetical protein